jgi:hypothetical protein
MNDSDDEYDAVTETMATSNDIDFAPSVLSSDSEDEEEDEEVRRGAHGPSPDDSKEVDVARSPRRQQVVPILDRCAAWHGRTQSFIVGARVSSIPRMPRT